MKRFDLSACALEFIVDTRALFAFGLGLLVAGKLSASRRRGAGWALAAAGAATTIPSGIILLRGYRRERTAARAGVRRDPALVGATRFPRKGDEPL
jgi:hypothetical protein